MGRHVEREREALRGIAEAASPRKGQVLSASATSEVRARISW